MASPPGGNSSRAAKSVRDLDERHGKSRRLRPQAQALLAGDTGQLARLTAEQADTLLQMLAYPEAIPGGQLGEELGEPRGVGLSRGMSNISDYESRRLSRK